MAFVLFRFSRQLVPFRTVIQFVGQIGPLMAMYSCSRKFEYAADREAVAYTGEPKVAIRALLSLHKANEAASESDGFTELFMKHPTLANRAKAIARNEHLPAEYLAEILRDSEGY